MYPLQQKTFSIGDKNTILYVPDPEAVKQSWENGSIAFPYWSQVWPSAVALGTYLSQLGPQLKNKTVLELAAGLGLPSLVAARHAQSVHCTEKEPAAVDLIQKSIQANRLQNVTTGILDWHCLPPALSADILLLSDINYDPSSFQVLKEMIHRFLAAGTRIILSTPQRLTAGTFLEPLLSFCIFSEVMEITHQGEEVPITIAVFDKKHSLLKTY